MCKNFTQWFFFFAFRASWEHNYTKYCNSKIARTPRPAVLLVQLEQRSWEAVWASYDLRWLPERVWGEMLQVGGFIGDRWLVGSGWRLWAGGVTGHTKGLHKLSHAATPHTVFPAYSSFCAFGGGHHSEIFPWEVERQKEGEKEEIKGRHTVWTTNSQGLEQKWDISTDVVLTFLIIVQKQRPWIYSHTFPVYPWSSSALCSHPFFFPPPLSLALSSRAADCQTGGRWQRK